MREDRPPSASASRVVPRGCRPWLVAAAWLIGPAAIAAEAPAGPPPGPVLHLTNGEFVAGTLEDSAQARILRWQPTSFVEPLDFGIDRVVSLDFRLPAGPPRPGGDVCFELAGGDVVFGSLVALDDREAVLDVTPFGRLHVQRRHLHRLERRRDHADVIYLGPNGLMDWQAPSPGGGWNDDAGQLWTEQPGASLRGALGLPARAVVEFAVSWKKKSDFVMALGVGDDEASISQAFRFEVWGDDLVVLRETAHQADVASVRKVAHGPGRAHVLAYLDQEQGRLQVFAPNGEPLADLTVADAQPQVLAGVALANIRGDVRLEKLRIGRWTGPLPRVARADEARLHRTDGSIVYGQITRFDAATREFVVHEKSGESRVAEDRVAGVFLSLPEDEPPREVRVVARDGTRLSGELRRVEKGELWLSLPGIREVVRVPVAGLRSVVVLRPGETPETREGPTGLLEIEGVRLRGRLAEGKARAGSSGLVWQPLGSATASPLRPGVSGRIVYKEPTRPPGPSGTRPVNAVVIGGGVVVQGNLVGGGVVQGNVIQRVSPSRPLVRAPQPRGPLALHLRTGDVIPAEVKKIDEAGVWFRTQLSEGTFVAHEKVKAVELAPEPIGASAIRLSKSKRERLLTLPRMQKESPPTHLIRSINGDYLRGHLIAMDDKTLQFEVRLETKEVPRDRVSRIIWFHPDELDASPGPAKPPEEGRSLRVQALRSDGIRLTFVPEQMADATLSGKSDVLGECRVRLRDVDQLLIGGAIEQTAAQLVYHQWKLHHAVEPKVAQGDAGGAPAGRAPGTESALVGKPAPDFELELLEGKTFRLAEARGQVVVLDFWATWCGPCLQAMPQVERVTQEFQDRGVRLVAVNLQETPKAITAMLERHKLRLTVALDRDGAVAEKYGATTIPQTVIIDRDGTIARLFVGGGPHLGDQLRDALQALGRSP